MIKKTALIGVLAVLCAEVGAQSSILKPLTVGDSLPEFAITNVLNYSANSISSSDFKNKLVILDFMTTGCKSCIEGLPRLSSIQKQFQSQVLVVLVSPEPVQAIRNFLRKKNINGLHLAFIPNDTLLSQLFSHTYISHNVVIKNKIVKAITWPEYIATTNIQAIMDGQNISLPLKRDITDFNFNAPLLSGTATNITPGSKLRLVGYTTVTSFIENLPRRFTRNIDSARKLLHISMINAPIVELYSRSQYGTGLQPSFMRIPLPNSTKYVYKYEKGYYHDWLAKNTFCYDGWFPLWICDSLIREKIRIDLNFYLGLDGRMEKQVMPCWVIRKTNSASITNDSAQQAMHNKTSISIQSIVYGLNQVYGGTPVIDESGVPNLTLYGLSPTQYKDIEIIRKHLNKYGLVIERASRLTNLLVITESN